MSCIKLNTAVARAMAEGYKEAFDQGLIKDRVSYKSLRSKAIQDELMLELEEQELQNQGRFILEDLQDFMKVAEDAYISELYRAYQSANSEGQNEIKKEKNLASSKWNALVNCYLDAKRQLEGQEVEI